MTKKLINRKLSIFLILAVSILSGGFCNSFASELSEMGLNVIPYPRQVKTGGPDFVFSNELTIVLDKDHSASDRFAADELIRDLQSECNVTARIGAKGTSSINSSYPSARHQNH